MNTPNSTTTALTTMPMTSKLFCTVHLNQYYSIANQNNSYFQMHLFLSCPDQNINNKMDNQEMSTGHRPMDDIHGITVAVSTVLTMLFCCFWYRGVCFVSSLFSLYKY